MPQRLSHVNCVSPARGDTSQISVAKRDSTFNCVSPASGETSQISVPLRFSDVNCVSPASGETSDIGLVCHLSPCIMPRSNLVRLVACSSPVRAAIPRPSASRRVKSSIASAVITASVGKPRVSRIAAAKLLSGMETTTSFSCAVAVVVSSVAVKNSAKTVMRFFFICVNLLVSCRGNGFGRVPRGFG